MKTIKTMITCCIMLSASNLSCSDQKKSSRQFPTTGTPLYAIPENKKSRTRSLTATQIRALAQPHESKRDISEAFNLSAEEIAYNNLSEEEREAYHRAITDSLLADKNKKSNQSREKAQQRKKEQVARRAFFTKLWS